MIGNDIIDLKFAKINSRWREQRFLDKLFSKEEKEFILSDRRHFQNIWHLWSMKESAYKIYARQTDSPSFNPKYFHCEINSITSGIVSFEGFKLNTNTQSDSNMIYTIAQHANTPSVSGCILLDGVSKPVRSQQLKDKAIEAFAVLKSVSKTAISIKKDHFGVPHFLINQEVQNNALTLTHHGQYGGFAIAYQ